MPPTIPKEIITLDPEGIDFNNREAVKVLIIKLSQYHRITSTAHT